MKSHVRPGFSLVEILVAMIVFAVGALGLAASSASLAHQVAANADRFRAVILTRNRLEAITASRCQASGGMERRGTVVNEWVASANGSIVTIDQSVTRVGSRGSHTDAVHGAALCR